MKTQKQNARITGLMYLLVIICAGFSQGYVRGTLIVPDDAVITANNILSHESLFRLGFVTDMVAFLLDVAISVMFYQLLKSTDKTLALVASAFRLLAHPAIASLNLLNHFMALTVLTNPSLTAHFDAEQLRSIALMLMESHRIGYLIAGAFFGIHCLLVGILIIRSGLIPKLFGLLMIFASVGYVMESFGDFLFPGNEEWLAWIVGMSAAAGEIALTLFLLIKGVKTQKGK